MSYTRILALLVVPALLLLQAASAADLTRRGLGSGGVSSSLTRRQNDGCPSGWGSCSETTCYPLDGSQCCSGASLFSAVFSVEDDILT
ncbi:hypothetical protein L227DRAFT_582025 [Lentinus tigrinus ALCF2SS1-6]|uniref:Uncharacterized protein n=1 Tax=Lentinus tigrinus ALCF2SS1-6 TaxID=1328759 RepID=A0A5C2RQ77_9APHY|nr:hypothetical protein L227DRAFT_582025 [Lentinus tigrinus ALCF2SS1-6]